MKIFHYTYITNWLNIKQNADEGNAEKAVLTPMRHFGSPGQEAFDILATFGVLESTPNEWANNEYFPSVWGDLRAHMGSLLTEITIDDLEGVYVVDWGHIAPHQLHGEISSDYPKKYFHTYFEEAEAAYAQSMIPIEEYLQRREELDYSLPEVIITKDVPFKNIKVSEEQPLIEAMLERFKNPEIALESYRGNNFKLSDLLEMDELKSWWEKFKPRWEEMQAEKEGRLPLG